MHLKKLQDIWWKISLSAKTHAKDGYDALDTEAWDLIQAVKKYQKEKAQVYADPGESSDSDDASVGGNSVSQREPQDDATTDISDDSDGNGPTDSDDSWEPLGNESEEDEGGIKETTEAAPFIIKKEK